MENSTTDSSIFLGNRCSIDLISKRISCIIFSSGRCSTTSNPDVFQSHQPSGRQVVSDLRASIHPSNSYIQSFVLEEGFSPPPTSSPGLWTVVSRGVVATYIRLFRHPGHHHFFIIFSTPFHIDFHSILTPNLEGKPIKNRSKIDPKSDLENFQLFTSIYYRFLMDLRLAGMSFLSFPPRREAHFRNFALLLLVPFFHPF